MPTQCQKLGCKPFHQKSISSQNKNRCGFLTCRGCNQQLLVDRFGFLEPKSAGRKITCCLAFVGSGCSVHKWICVASNTQNKIDPNSWGDFKMCWVQSTTISKPRVGLLHDLCTHLCFNLVQLPNLAVERKP